MKSKLAFFKAFLDEFHNTGAIFPSSQWVGKALCSPFSQLKTPANIIEVGSGTGAITKVILESLRENDKLTLCEINKDLVKVLKKRLSSHKSYSSHKDNINFFSGPIQKLDSPFQYDLIVCSLPFLNFTPELVEEIFIKLNQIAAPDAYLTFFNYIGFDTLGRNMPGKRKARIRKIEEFYKNQKYFKLVEEVNVWLNLTPAKARVLKVIK